MARVTDVRYIGYGLPEVSAERAFYQDIWGLRPVSSDDGMVYFATHGDAEPYVVRLREAPSRRIDVIALAAESRADVETLHDRVVAAGCRIITPPAVLQGPAGGYGFRFFSADGLPFEISSEVAPGQSRDLKRWEGIPVGISHIVLHSPDHRGAVAFFTDVLGFKISDWLGDFMCFLRCNEYHHRIAFLPGPACLNHVAYDMLTVDDMMRGVARLKKHGVDLRWGPGRHTAGDNTFSYFTTPAGFAVEYTSGLERIDEATWTPQSYPMEPGIMDQWGIGIGGPQTMPHPAPDGGLFQPAGV